MPRRRAMPVASQSPGAFQSSEAQASAAQQRLQRAHEAYRKKVGVVTSKESDYWCYGHMVPEPPTTRPASEGQ